MPMIKVAVEFSEPAKQLIKAAQERPDYNHKVWDSDELQEVRREVRDHYRQEQRLNCAYCLNPVGARSAASAPIEHIAAKSAYLRYMFEPKNLCVSCADCNEYKRDREVLVDPVISGRVTRTYPNRSDAFRIVHPHLDKYTTHIRRAGFLYFPVTPKGSYTAYVCNLWRYLQALGMSEELFNDLEVVAMRHRFHNT